MPSKTMRNIVGQVKKLRETMESILSQQQLEVSTTLYYQNMTILNIWGRFVP